MTEIDYGPLTGLIGHWEGDHGLDIAPEPGGTEQNPFFETIVFSPAGDVVNAERQRLVAVRYHQVVSRKTDRQVFHDESGYWMWDSEQGLIMHSLTIPRAVCVLAGGSCRWPAATPGEYTLGVQARLGDPDWSIIQSPFMRDRARTVEFHHEITIRPRQLVYTETTTLQIYDRVFEHTDQNTLQRRS